MKSLQTTNYEALTGRFGTPLLVIDEDALRAKVREFVAAFAPFGQVVYAAKALPLLEVLRIVWSEGMAVDVCSLGEMETALRAGIPRENLIMDGCYKTKDELYASVGCALVVIDNWDEISRLDELCSIRDTTQNVLVRVNPEIEDHGHVAVYTSGGGAKFGFSRAEAPEATKAVQSSNRLNLQGLHCHIGTNITDMHLYRRALTALLNVGDFSVLDVGGGLACGVPAEEWAKACNRDWRVIVEPGRAIINDAGTTLYRIGVRKGLADGSQALIVDGGLSDNPRPAMYGARYEPQLIGDCTGKVSRFNVFGRHCETDLLFADVPLPDPQPGDLLAVPGTGAYTYAMASNYNRFPKPAVVMVHDGQAKVIAERESLGHMLELDV